MGVAARRGAPYLCTVLKRIRVPVARGLFAVAVGAVVMVIGDRLYGPPAGLLATTASLSFLYFIAGSILGLMWPRPSWAWGVWIALPLAGLILLSVAFTGQVDAFVRHDLAPLLGAIGGGMLGGVAGAAGRDES